MKRKRPGKFYLERITILCLLVYFSLSCLFYFVLKWSLTLSIVLGYMSVPVVIGIELARARRDAAKRQKGDNDEADKVA